MLSIYDSFKKLEQDLHKTNERLSENEAKDEIFRIIKDNQSLGEDFFRQSKDLHLYSDKLNLLKKLIDTKPNKSLYYKNIDSYYKKIRGL